jgi:hypothetical protein
MCRLWLSLVLGVSVAGASLWAQNVHLKGGNNAEPALTDLGLALQAAGSLAGLGNGDVLITMRAQADVTATCANPSGHEAPGQNPAPLTVSGSQAIPEDELKNGNTPFHVETIAPVASILGAPDCPNVQWTEAIVDLSFTAAVISVEQPPGTTVLTVSCTIAPPSVNGAVSRADVVCTTV